jgi:hypothetical protein
MRVWLVLDEMAETAGLLKAAFADLASRSGAELLLLNASPGRPSLSEEVRSGNPDLLVIAQSQLPNDRDLEELLETGVGLVVLTTPEATERLLPFAEHYPVWLLPAAPGLDALQLALLGAFLARRRHQSWTAEVARLQQRLTDRIVIERAKGILVQRLQIPEEQAYQRLRALSRRQRRPIRDIAQSLLDTQSLFSPDLNGCVAPAANLPPDASA